MKLVVICEFPAETFTFLHVEIRVDKLHKLTSTTHLLAPAMSHLYTKVVIVFSLLPQAALDGRNISMRQWAGGPYASSNDAERARKKIDYAKFSVNLPCSVVRSACRQRPKRACLPKMISQTYSACS